MHILGAYVRCNLPVARDLTLEDSNESFICFRLALLHSTTYLFFLYQSPTPSYSVVEAVSSNIDKARGIQPADIIVCGDFNARNPDWLVHSHTTDAAGLSCHDFAMSQDLTQIVGFPTRIPDWDVHQPFLSVSLFQSSKMINLYPSSIGKLITL